MLIWPSDWPIKQKLSEEEEEEDDRGERGEEEEKDEEKELERVMGVEKGTFVVWWREGKHWTQSGLDPMVSVSTTQN